jgi:hypothetical protein
MKFVHASRPAAFTPSPRRPTGSYFRRSAINSAFYREEESDAPIVSPPPDCERRRHRAIRMPFYSMRSM